LSAFSKSRLLLHDPSADLPETHFGFANKNEIVVLLEVDFGFHFCTLIQTVDDQPVRKAFSTARRNKLKRLSA